MGRKVVPDGALLPLARPRQHQAPEKWNWIGSMGGCGPKARAGAPLVQTLMSATWVLNAPFTCACRKCMGNIQKRTSGYARRGAFSPYSRHASLIQVSAQFGREVPADYPLPVAPQQVRKAKHTCRRPGCPFKTEGTKSICDRSSSLGRRQDVTSTCML